MPAQVKYAILPDNIAEAEVVVKEATEYMQV